MTTNTTHHLRMTVYTSLMAAMIAAGAFIAIPVGPVPIVLQNMFVLLAALLLGRNWAVACVSIYLLAGALGLPVFATGKGGFTTFAGPTGGYLLGYLVAAYVVGWISETFASGGNDGSPTKRLVADIVAMVIGSLIVYACGAPWLKMVLKIDTWTAAIAAGVLPFLIGDAAKIVAAAFIARIIRPVIKRELP